MAGAAAAAAAFASAHHASRLPGKLPAPASLRRLLFWLVIVTLALSLLYGGSLYTSPPAGDLGGRDPRPSDECADASSCSPVTAESIRGAQLLDGADRRATVLTASENVGLVRAVPTKSEESGEIEEVARSDAEPFQLRLGGAGWDAEVRSSEKDDDAGVRNDAPDGGARVEITAGQPSGRSGRDEGEVIVQSVGETGKWNASKKSASAAAAQVSKPAVRGEVGYSATHELPSPKPRTFSLNLPPRHWSYNALLQSLSEDDRELLDQFREDYRGQSPFDDLTCGTWQRAYAASHEAAMDGRNGPARTAAYICRRGTNCGGLADRLLGMVSVFVFSLLDRRAFLAHWDFPLPLEALFEPATVDWSLRASGFHSAGKLDRDRAFYEGRGQEVSMIHSSASLVDQTIIHPPGGWEKQFPEDHVTFLTNRGAAMRLFKSPNHGPRLLELGLAYETVFGCAVDYVLRPRPAILDAVSDFVALFRLPLVFSVGIQIRTGDSAMINPRADLANLRNFDYFFACAEQVARARAAPNQIVVFFLLTDSRRLRQQAEDKFRETSAATHQSGRGPHLLVSGMPIVHIHRSSDASGAAGSVIESWALAATDFRVISPGGYGKIAAFHSRSPNSTIVLPNSPSNDRRHVIPEDCGHPSAFTPFEKMAQEWSLG